MSTRRIITGFLIAPLIIPLVYGLGVIAMGQGVRPIAPRDVLLGALLMTGPFAYAVAFIMGIPGFLLLKSLGWFRLPLVVGLGILVGLGVPLVLNVPRLEIFLGPLAGALAATGFWFITLTKREPIDKEKP